MKKRARRPKAAKPSIPIQTEAQRIYDQAVFGAELARDLINRFVSATSVPRQRENLRFDYQEIADSLAQGDPMSGDLESDSRAERWPKKAIFERYAHHFENRSQVIFFNLLDAEIRACLADLVFIQSTAGLNGTEIALETTWDESLLPREAAPHLIRQWCRDRTALWKFLRALFAHWRRFHRKGSTGRRAIIIAQGALKVKWKPSAHVENLVKTGDVQLGKSEYKADAKAAKDRHAAYVGRSIRRLRQKAQKPL